MFAKRNRCTPGTTIEFRYLHKNPFDYGKVFEKVPGQGGAGNERKKTRNIKKRPQRKKSHQPQTSDRHRTVRSAKRRRQSTQKEKRPQKGGAKEKIGRQKEITPTLFYHPYPSFLSPFLFSSPPVFLYVPPSYSFFPPLLPLPPLSLHTPS